MMKIRISYFSLIFLLFFLSACSSAATSAPAEMAAPPAAEAPAAEAPMAAAPAPSQPSAPPKFINHPTQEYSTSLGAFSFGGCDAESTLCPPDSSIGQLGCQRVVGRDLLGGLTPPIPAAWCIYETGTPPNPDVYEFIPNPYPHFRAIIVYNEGEYTLLNDPATLQALYAPIDSPEEALSYALLLNDLEPRYAQAIVPGARYFTDVVEDTDISETESGYTIRLFSTEQIADCKRLVYAVTIAVRRSGQMDLQNKVLQYLEQFCP